MADVQVEFGAKIDQLVAGVAAVRAQLGTISQETEKLSAGFAKMGSVASQALGALGIGTSVAGFTSWVRGMAEAGLNAERLSAELGITGAGLGELRTLAKLTGVDMETLALSIERMSLNIQRSTRDAFTPQAQALKVLGLSAKDLIGIPADQYFNKLADAVSKFNPSLNLTNALMAIGGRTATQMLPALLLGRDAMEKWQAQMQEAKFGLQGFAAAGADTHARLTVLDTWLSTTSKRIFLELKPSIDAVVQSFIEFVKWINAAAREGGTLSYVFSAVGTSVKVAATAIVATVGVLQALGTAVSAVMKLAFGDIEEFEKYAKDSVTEFETLAKRYKEIVTGIWSDAGRQRITVTPKQDASAINEAARQQIEARRSALEGEIALAKGGLEQQKVIFQQGADLYQISEQRKLQFTRDAATAEYQTEIAKLQQIRDLWPAHTKEWEDANRKMAQTTQAFGTEILRINADMMRDYKAKFDETFGALQSSFNGQLRGLIAGTTSWRDAFKTIMGDMLIFFIQLVEKMVFQWISGKLAMLAVDRSTAAAQVTTEQAAQTASLPGRIAKFTSDITADSALVFGGIFANLAPLLGPAAAAPAEAGQASVLAQLAAIPKFEMGTDFVPYTGLAIVHEGEKIVPAAENRAGGSSHPITIVAWDGQSVERWLKSGGATMLAGAVSKSMTKNRSLRPGF